MSRVFRRPGVGVPPAVDGQRVSNIMLFEGLTMSERDNAVKSVKDNGRINHLIVV